ncbi:ATP synthase subunit I [Sphingomonas sp. AP4-R1]|uniref:N-ATPase subunit AtpR n=1 Tax=Sphingomonas sp. AP4-R1 TaxID=2735134 RepID=UPI0014937513|nr:ATP synthase subunit I [Sphingomonas sp. AP4-R1]QJU58280.1 ATP synthase subunit I [Sphingomonas sp. AP4-R1]
MSTLTSLLFLALGFAAGLGHFWAIAREADDLVRGGPAWRLILLRLGRLAVTILVLVIASLQGWPALFAATLGFMAGRQLVLYRLGGAR